MTYVLQLNADYTPMKVIRWERAVEMMLDQKVTLVSACGGRFVRSPSLLIPWPAVVALRRFSRINGKIGYSGRNVAARDAWICGYCGRRPTHPDGRIDHAELTLDHVVPRAQAREGKVWLPWARRWAPVSCWENAITACRACNARKADRTPAQANMTLRVVPRVPTQADALRIALARFPDLPEEWAPWLPAEPRVVLHEAPLEKISFGG